MKEFQNRPKTIEGGISDAAKSYLDMFYFYKQEMSNMTGIPKDIPQDFSIGSLEGLAQLAGLQPNITRIVSIIESRYEEEIKALRAEVFAPILKDAKIFIRKQVRFPKSKVKRIRDKWAKQEKNYKLVEANLTFTF